VGAPVYPLDETVALWRALWAGATSFRGELLHFEDLPPMTRPFQKQGRTSGPPVWLGGASESALLRTGRRYDGWLPYPPAPGEYGAGLATIAAAATSAGRRPEDISPGLFVSVALTDSVESGRRMLAEFSEASYGLPLAQLETIQALAAGPPGYVAEQLSGYVAAGARHLVIRIAATSLIEQRAQLEQIIALKPLLRAHTCVA
jgi:alkanesulfonate monooxygenase SsuD/methylene tetrahydromethanopterin reductase-like flavin-dependent oxidoreductase (luciferase family)